MAAFSLHLNRQEKVKVCYTKCMSFLDSLVKMAKEVNDMSDKLNEVKKEVVSSVMEVHGGVSTVVNETMQEVTNIKNDVLGAGQDIKNKVIPADLTSKTSNSTEK